MTGKMVTLSKPLVVMEKSNSLASASGTAAAGVFGTPYVIKAVVRRKLLFEDRPQPIVSARHAS